MVQVGDGNAFVTGYFEPEIAGSRTRQPGFEVPVYRKPPDLVEVDAATAEAAEAAGTPRRGRLENGVVVPYFERSEIEDGALANRGLEIAWAADEIDFFFLQIQGSGRLRLPDGGVMRIGYAGQNGREYVGIGKLMKDRGLLGPGQTSMQGIVAWLRANPEEGKGDHAREQELHILPGADRAGPARRPRPAGHRPGNRRHRSQIRADGRPGPPPARPARGERTVDRPGYGRRDQGLQPLRHLLGRRRRKRRGSPAGCRAAAAPASSCQRALWRGSMRRLNPDEAKLWAKVVEIGAAA